MLLFIKQLLISSKKIHKFELIACETIRIALIERTMGRSFSDANRIT